MKATVKDVISKTIPTKRGPAPVYSFIADDGQKYDLGFKKPAFGIGAEVDFEFENTMYGNKISSLTVITAGTTSAPAAKPGYTPRPGFVPGGGSKGVFPIPATDGQRSILRQNALTNARELVVTAFVHDKQNLNSDDAVKAIIRVAKMFEAYTAGDHEALAAKKAKEADAKKDD